MPEHLHTTDGEVASSPRLRDKIWEGPGDEANREVRRVDTRVLLHFHS